ncbi:MAG: cobalamin-binding protein [Paracoccaceae bacterium]|nr:MAG: cobalamin-binding protein [Alphaproteobacteria bacterium]GIX12976.1 MAG: cobalamin-binding protein [Paracoccaceae bacterium]
MTRLPRRIVCLSAETVETLYLLGEEARIVGVTGYAVRPARVRREKPRVGAFSSADLPRILALDPDLVLVYSDIQADIAAALIRAGVAVHAFNQRDIAGILAMIATLGALVGAEARAAALIARLEAGIEAVAAPRRGLPPLPVYVEEWDRPMIAGIGWISELVALAGGRDIFADRARAATARERIVTDAEVIARAPELIIASWCGRRVRPERIRDRPGWQAVPAVRAGRIAEIRAPILLAPGPAVLTDGLAAVAQAIDAARAGAEAAA